MPQPSCGKRVGRKEGEVSNVPSLGSGTGTEVLNADGEHDFLTGRGRAGAAAIFGVRRGQYKGGW